MKKNITIRLMKESDIDTICREEAAQGWHPEPEKYQMRIEHMNQGKSIAWVAEYNGEIAGYNHLYFEPQNLNGPFVGKGIPEIVDFGVFERFRRRGIGTKLMDIAELAAGERSNFVSLGVGLHSGYGSAQRMYVKRGYIPDGSGVLFQDKICPEYSSCMNDDDLVLYLSKKL